MRLMNGGGVLTQMMSGYVQASGNSGSTYACYDGGGRVMHVGSMAALM